MKKVSGFICMLLICFLVMPMAACGGGSNKRAENTLYIGNYNGGMKSEWLEPIIAAFKTKYPEINVEVDNKLTEYQGSGLLTTMPNNRQDIYFTTEVSYDDAIAQGKFADITDVVTEKFDTVDGELQSVEDKMNEQIANYFKRDGKYYAIPFFTALYGIVYDRDLFEARNLFNLEGYSTDVGPDGVKGTGDDGLPVTYEDLTILMSIMKESGITPFVFSGMHHYYRLAFLRALWASYEGYDDFMLNYTFDGTDDQPGIGKIDASNGYLLQNQNGKRAAIQVAWDIIKKGYCTQSSTLTGSTHTDAQDEFISSWAHGRAPVGMLIEGGWWENEAKPAFDELASDLDDEKWGYGERRFGFLPMPKFKGTTNIPDQGDHATTLYSDGNTMVFVNANSPQLEWAKKFLQFSTSNESLAACTKITGVVRPFKYTMQQSDLNTMTYFGQSIWDTYSRNSDNLVVSYNMSKLRQAEPSYFKAKWEYTVNVGNKEYVEPFIPFSNSNTNGLTVEKYCQGFIDNYSKSQWDAKFKNKFYPD